VLAGNLGDKMTSGVTRDTERLAREVPRARIRTPCAAGLKDLQRMIRYFLGSSRMLFTSFCVWSTSVFIGVIVDGAVLFEQLPIVHYVTLSSSCVRMLSSGTVTPYSWPASWRSSGSLASLPI